MHVNAEPQENSSSDAQNLTDINARHEIEENERSSEENTDEKSTDEKFTSEKNRDENNTEETKAEQSQNNEYKFLGKYVSQHTLFKLEEYWENVKAIPKPKIALIPIIGLFSFYFISMIFGILYFPATDLICNHTPYSELVFSFCKLAIPNFSAIVDAQIEAQERLLKQAAELDAEGSLAHDIKRAELATKDLMLIVKYSDLKSKEILSLKLKEFADTSFEANSDLQTLQIRAQTSLDNTITYISYTLKTIEDFSGKIISPRQERDLNKHHDMLMKLTDDDLRKLIVATDNTLNILKKLDVIQDGIRDITGQEESLQQMSEAELLSELWSILGGNHVEKTIFKNNLKLLKNLDNKRKVAVERISLISGYLIKFQQQLGFLREATVLRLLVDIPLEIHLTNMKKALMRLQNNEITAGVKAKMDKINERVIHAI
ncbi:12707_t:CDS:2 [Funneliformis geosporum]|uniref:6702_t:CDS:1 n=1 Tax=Funneliformis geosporum TaxID=1117311 RepID=A0A9W4SH17_9GLOM|nr:12707_t:CDS:2 [Funneliformis geosporum]CAI2168199.1 6702_t:CDS:2 [Funneliformis geosporum]